MIMPKRIDLDFSPSAGTVITPITASKTPVFGNTFNPNSGDEEPMRRARATLIIILLLSGCIGQGGQGNNPGIDDDDDDGTGDGGVNSNGNGGGSDEGTDNGTDNGTTTPPPANDSIFTFTSGFGPGVSIAPYDDRLADIVGADNSSNSSDWQADLETGAPFGDARFFFEGGNDSQRSARIVDEDGEDVLEFRLAEANVNDGEKGRVTIRISNNENLTRFGYSVDVKLKDAFDLILQSNQTVNWLTLAEFWNDVPEKEFSFRITLAIHKESTDPGTPLTWNIHGQTQNNETLAWDDVWEFSSNAPVPLDEWFKLEVEIIEGDNESGHVAMHLTDDNGTRWTLIDETVWTHHPDDPNPDGIQTFNPMKLYTSGALLAQIPEGRALVVLWDNFTLYGYLD